MRNIRAFLLLGCLVTLCAATEASVLSVSPTRLFVSPDGNATAIKLKNGGDEKALVEVKVFAWTDIDDSTALKSTEDFLVAPPIFEVLPETTQTLRLISRVDSSIDTERMYRVVISEVASEVGPVNGVGFAVEMSLPIFLAPEGAEADPVWSLDWKDIATPELKLVNHGDAHVRVRSFEIIDDSSGKSILRSEDAAYIQAGKEKIWPLKEISFGSDVEILKVKAVTTRGLIEVSLAFPNG